MFMRKITVRIIVATVLIAFVYIALGALAGADAPPEEEIPVADYPPNFYLTLINKQHRLPDDWTSQFDFLVGRNALGELFIVESESLLSFYSLRDYLLEQANVQIELDSIYRSLDEQQDIWDIWSADPEKGPDYCAQYLAPVGCSEHHTGLALDIFLIKDGEIIRDNDATLADTEDFAKVHAALAKFGFILRYPDGKEAITGYSYEPWHLRYVGDATIASDIMSRGLTLEEYLAEIPA